MPQTLCVLGDGLVAGFGDARHLGWVGRVLARTTTPDPLFTAVLPVIGETTTSLAARWKEETSRRWQPDGARYLVLAPGAADVNAGLSLARSRLNLANILDDARADGAATFVVGPAPSRATEARAAAALSKAWSDVCERRSIPYVECHEPLAGNSQWLADIDLSDGVHPTQVGYGMLAWLVLHQQWYDWLGGTET